MRNYGEAHCIDCGTHFVRQSGNAKRCKPCGMKKQGTTGIGIRPKPCVRCGNEFKPTGSSQIYCVSCKPAAYRENNIRSLKALRLSRGIVPIGSTQNCAECGSAFIFLHGAKKLCDPCQTKKRRAMVSRYHAKNPEKIKQWAKNARDNAAIGGSRKLVLARDKHTCQKCGKHPANVVHHIDCFGEKSGAPNNTTSNLVTLCASCHSGIHAMIDKLTRERHQSTILEAYAIFDHSHWRPQA